MVFKSLAFFYYFLIWKRAPLLLGLLLGLLGSTKKARPFCWLTEKAGAGKRKRIDVKWGPLSFEVQKNMAILGVDFSSPAQHSIKFN